MEPNPLDTVVGLEFELLDPDVRRDASRLVELIDESFVEFGQSGRVWRQPDLIEALVSEQPIDPPAVDELESRHITPDVIVVTYRTSRDGRPTAMRSSWWRRTDMTWRIVFHQATVV